MNAAWGFVALIGVVVALLAGSEYARAHAAYEDSSPAFAEVLDGAPARIALRFTQELFREEGANTLSLTHESGEVIAVGAFAIDNADRRRAAAEVLGNMPAGRYVVSWTNLSADDGDDDSGSYPFYVGREPSAEQSALDRELAAALLIAFPGEAIEEAGEAALPAPPPATERAVAAGGIGAGSVALLAAGAVALAGLGAALRPGTRRR